MTEKNNKGITLVALVLTIIILLILAGISISALTNTGIFEKAKDAKNKTEEAEKNQQAILDEYEAKLNEYGITEKDIVDKKSKVGYYADIDADGTVDGIIYADLAVGTTGSGQWSNSVGSYSIPTIGNLKNYYVSQKNYNGIFGIKDVLSPVGNGNERFYVMALEDIDKNQDETYYDWYNTAYGNMKDFSIATSISFGKGKSNTSTMIAKWEAKEYGEQNQCSDHKDMWGQIKSQVEKGWFVPSKEEWSAFAEELHISNSNYKTFKLSEYYWSSSQNGDELAWDIYFKYNNMDSNGVSYNASVRLSKIF